MDLRTLSEPAGGDKRRKHAPNPMRGKAKREELKKLVDRVVNHDRNAANHRGHMDAFTVAQELTTYVRGALAVVQPYEPDGTPRPQGDKAEFFTWLDKLRDLLALRLPYERPRLASVTVQHQEGPEERKPYVTIPELRHRMMEQGIPTDHLEDGDELILEHELDDDAAGSGQGAG